MNALWNWLHAEGHAPERVKLPKFRVETVAAIYDSIFGWFAPYAYFTVPVVLGTVGGIGLLVGTVGLLVQRRRRDPALADPDQDGLDQHASKNGHGPPL